METIVEQSKFKSKIGGNSAKPVRISEVKKENYQKRVSTGIGEFDRVLGGGIVNGMVTLVAGEPGIGKSTLLLQLADRLQTTDYGRKSVDGRRSTVVYIAGEESASQIANRAARLGIKGGNIVVLEETDVDAMLEQVGKVEKVDKSRDVRSTLSTSSTFPTCIIVDSIQTMTTGDLTGSAGSVGQVRECTQRLAGFAKKTGIPVFIVGHVTKEGAIAGPRVLEHIVDTVVWFEGERSGQLRMIKAVKNRFGATDEVGVFAMEEKGLAQVTNPGKFFLGESGKVPGSAITAVLEGTRPMLIEIQALVVQTKLAFPKRSGVGIDPRRLEIIIAVLTRRVGLPLWDYDIFVNVTGGIRVTEPAADLAIALAVASAFHNKPISPTCVAFGEVGLLGEIREVPGREKRGKEAKRIGFTGTITNKEARTVAEAIRRYVSAK